MTYVMSISSHRRISLSSNRLSSNRSVIMTCQRSTHGSESRITAARCQGEHDFLLNSSYVKALNWCFLGLTRRVSCEQYPSYQVIIRHQAAESSLPANKGYATRGEALDIVPSNGIWFVLLHELFFCCASQVRRHELIPLTKVNLGSSFSMKTASCSGVLTPNSAQSGFVMSDAGSPVSNLIRKNSSRDSCRKW